MEAGLIAVEGGLHVYLYGERRGGGDWFSLWLFRWRGLDGGNSYSYRRGVLTPHRSCYGFRARSYHGSRDIECVRRFFQAITA
jgi:hypothetical protein